MAGSRASATVISRPYPDIRQQEKLTNGYAADKCGRRGSAILDRTVPIYAAEVADDALGLLMRISLTEGGQACVAPARKLL